MPSKTIDRPPFVWDPGMGKRIAILFHEKQDPKRRDHAIYHLAAAWKEAGHTVKFVFGVRKVVPADLAILHVDLSVVPDEYLAFARRYPIVLNGSVKDVRKSSFSTNLVRAGDSYAGRVIVKSDLNYAGLPERMLAPGEMADLPPELQFNAPTDYKIYSSLREVPEPYFECNSVVIERFIPEMEGDLYCVRMYQFLGDRMNCVRIASPHPIVKSDNKVGREPVEPHPDILAQRERLKFDFGKFDYVVHDGRAELLDVNKTPGEGPTLDPRVRARLRYRAEGLYSYFRDAR